MHLTISEAAIALGFKSRSSLYRLLQRGDLVDFERTGPNGERLLELDGLADRVRSLLRRQINTPAAPKPSATPARDWWAKVAPLANSYLDIPQWGPPPWNGLQWSSLAMVLSLAADEVNGQE
jgi:hypothetical protein